MMREIDFTEKNLDIIKKEIENGTAYNGALKLIESLQNQILYLRGIIDRYEENTNWYREHLLDEVDKWKEKFNLLKKETALHHDVKSDLKLSKKVNKKPARYSAKGH